MAGDIELWTGFKNRKLAAERAKNDWQGNLIVPAKDATITIKVADASTGPTAGSFTTNQASPGTITIPAAVSASGGGTATPGVMSAADKEKLDGISDGANKVEADPHNWGSILIDNVQTTIYVHPSAGPNTEKSVGDTTNQTPGFGDTFKVTSETVNTDGHTTVIEEHTVTIPSATAVASTSGASGSDGLMSAQDKEKLDGIETGAQVNVKPDWNAASGSAAGILNKPTIPTVNDTTITVAYGTSSDSFTTNTDTAKTITIPTAASASGSTAATGGLMSATDKENLDWLTSVTPSSGTHAATPSNTVVTQSEMAAAIADFGGYEVATGTDPDNHPDVQNPSTKIIYLVKDADAPGDDKYNEWIYYGDPSPAWQLIGTTSMDLTGYAKIPSGAGQNHVVLFGNDETLVDSNKVISDLENVITGISVNGVAQTPTNKVIDIAVPQAEGTTVPLMNGTASVGSATTFSKSDHVHPSDTSKQDVLTFNTAYDASTNKAATMADITAAGNAKADKVTNATSGHFAGLDTNGNLTDSGSKASDFKTVQTAVSDPTASGNATSFIDTISQDTNGVITVTKKTVPTVAKSTATVGGNDGLMTAAQAEALYDLNTWTYATFSDSGAGDDVPVVFPVAAQSGN